MKISIAQIRSKKGDVDRNIHNHLEMIGTAVSQNVEMIIFPELSLTGYEPELAEKLATTQEDSRFEVFQKISEQHQITIGTGMPLKSSDGIIIGMIIFHPQKGRQVYGKKYLHADEKPFFVPGSHLPELLGPKRNIAPAICYEISVPAHPEAAHKAGAEIYLASVAKTPSGVRQAHRQLSHTAQKYSMRVLMANAVGEADGDICAGQSAIWNKEGELLGQLDDSKEGLLVFDTDSQEVVVI